MVKNVLATVAFNTGIAIVVAALLIWFGDVRASSSMLEMLLGSMIYSQLVGTTTSLTMEWLLPKLAQKRPAVFISCVAVLLTITAFVGTVASTLVFSALGYGMKHFWIRVEYGMRISLVVTFVVGFIASMNGYYARRLERAQQLATEAKLQSLESLVHPHFLFNTLNSISSLTHEDPDKAGYDPEICGPPYPDNAIVVLGTDATLNEMTKCFDGACNNVPSCVSNALKCR